MLSKVYEIRGKYPEVFDITKNDDFAERMVSVLLSTCVQTLNLRVCTLWNVYICLDTIHVNFIYLHTYIHKNACGP